MYKVVSFIALIVFVVLVAFTAQGIIHYKKVLICQKETGHPCVMRAVPQGWEVRP